MVLVGRCPRDLCPVGRCPRIMVLVGTGLGDCGPSGEMSKELCSWWGDVLRNMVLVGSCPRDCGPGG